MNLERNSQLCCCFSVLLHLCYCHSLLQPVWNDKPFQEARFTSYSKWVSTPLLFTSNRKHLDIFFPTLWLECFMAFGIRAWENRAPHLSYDMLKRQMWTDRDVLPIQVNNKSLAIKTFNLQNWHLQRKQCYYCNSEEKVHLKWLLLTEKKCTRSGLKHFLWYSSLIFYGVIISCNKIY